MVKRYRFSWSILRFNDTITIYNKIDDDTWNKTTVEGVQWTDKYEKQNDSGKLNVARYASITFPEGTYEGLVLNPSNEEDAIVYGNIEDDVTNEKGHRISDLLHKYQKSGLIQSVNDNSNRTHLKNIKVVVA